MTTYRAVSSVSGCIYHAASVARACAAMTDHMLCGGQWLRSAERMEAPSVWGMPVIVYSRIDQGFPPEAVGVYEVSGVSLEDHGTHHPQRTTP